MVIRGSSLRSVVLRGENAQLQPQTLFDSEIFDSALFGGTAHLFDSNVFDLTIFETEGYHQSTQALQVWNGTSWVAGTIRRWSGSAWVDATIKRWSGSAWV